MGSTNNFLEEFRNYLSMINEDYIIGISNKGILNRAKKELESGEEIDIIFNEDNVECRLKDGTICNINADIKNFKCSCPSRSICKHVVKSYLYAASHSKELFKGKGNSNSKEESLDFSELIKIDIKQIKKVISDRDIKNILKKIEFGFFPEIEEDNILKISFPEENIVVKFIKTKAVEEMIDINKSSILNNSLCSCKEKDICKHKLEALIHYKLLKKAIKYDDINALIEEEFNFKKEDFVSTLEGIKGIVAEIYIGGLARVSENLCQQLEQMALIAHNNNLPSLEKRIRAIGANLQLYINKNASFNIKNFRKQMHQIYKIINAMENSKDRKLVREFMGRYKTNYYDLPAIELWCLGAKAWSTASGYKGITFYFHNDKFKKLFTYTESRADYYEEAKKYNFYDKEAPWGIQGRQSEFSRSHIKLFKGKINDEFRLSSSAESRGELLERTRIKDLALKELIFEDWEQLFFSLENSIENSYASSKQDNIFLLKISSNDESSFNNIGQVFSMAIYDMKGRKIFIRLKYTKENKKLIENIESAERNNMPYMILSEVYIYEGEIIAVPITAYYNNDRSINWTLE
ncbi:SWIM zinc finger family protein [Clostridium sp. 19966]|uniref:SWIM zinc finger family protein n=1 Tax=Clostridium sp. 19966 TaxID=2768166 RepID=UPI0028E02EC4|nr:SWIM zinc finger family protein [Clostridium sp. 19966]MDT8717916.1 SWIM zinc finger family protein [Clostridium sp. 19966]